MQAPQTSPSPFGSKTTEKTKFYLLVPCLFDVVCLCYFAYCRHKKLITRQDKNSGNMLTHTRIIYRDLMGSATVLLSEKRKSWLSLEVKNISEVFQMSPIVRKRTR